MGSAPSKSLVMDIHVPANEAERDPKDLYKTPLNYVKNGDGLSDTRRKLKETDVVAILLQVREELCQSKQKTARAEEQIAVLQKQLKEREDEILSLQTQVEIYDARMEQEQAPVMERTIKAKDQYIHRLEAEVQQLKQQSTEVNEKYARKLHKVRALSSKSRQDSQLKVFELKDANSKLKEENTKLKERLDRTSIGSASSSRDAAGDEESLDAEAPVEDARTKVILELSQQVAELDQENSRLKRELKQSRKIAGKVERTRSSGTITSESLCLRTSVAEASPTFIKSS